MQLTSTEKIDIVNIGLMLVSCCVAMVLPFELFLFSYAILGPLHYLTEISWLHDKKYYTKERYDAIILVVIGLLITLKFYDRFIEIDFPEGFDANLAYIALLGSIIFVTVKNPFYRIGGIAVLILSSQVAHNFMLFFTVFLPTLIHVYFFTALFMLYGAIKSQSRFGIPSVIAMVLCPILLYVVFPNKAFYPPTEYSVNAYQLFKVVNINWLMHVQGVPVQADLSAWDKIIFRSSEGILLMRFIAFAYTYHYLNWFSKTKIIQWHNVPKARFAVVILLWLVSVGLYITDYSMGLQWLVFLSFLHVLLEFPLNVTSIIGIGNYFKGRMFKSAKA
ncbi:hypothetical protein CAP35_04570 [Chitinophagaceae bacterium IBVUCB1]|nr:hypothetical protein CAP35_04570 [Chitinophagaceae bacterium IBVUCB1]